MNTSELKSSKPKFAFLISHPAHAIGLGFGVGLISIAPGTFGTGLAIPLYLFLDIAFDSTLLLLVLVLMFGIGSWACHVTGSSLGEHDSGIIVWDETVGFCFVLFFTPSGNFWLLIAFVLFRVFDIYKPYPINMIDQNLTNGFGVMLDDLFAAFYSVLCLALIKLIFIP